MQSEIQRPRATDYGQPIQPGRQLLKLFLNTLVAIFFILGVALAFGNKTGRFVTFPFSGFTAMGICGILARANNANKKGNSLPAQEGGFSPNPSDVSSAFDSQIKYKSFAEVPWFRREPNGIIVLLLLVFPPALLALCIIAFTGDVCRNAYDKNGNLVTWGIASKSAAIILLFAQLSLAAIYYETNKSDGLQSGEIQSAQPTQVTPVIFFISVQCISQSCAALMAFARTYFKQYNTYKKENKKANKEKESLWKLILIHFCQNQFH